MKYDVEVIWSFILDYVKGWGVRKHTHDFFQTYFCMMGNGEVILNGNNYSLCKNDCLMIWPHQNHEIKPFNSGHMRIADTKFLINDTALAKKILQLPQIVNFINSDIQTHMQTIRDEWVSQQNHYKEICNLSFQKFLYLYTREFIGKIQPTQFQFIYAKTNNLTGPSKQIANFLKNHFTENLSLNEISQSVSYNKNYICKVFKKKVGYTIIEYINLLRIEMAYEMITNTSQTISDISISCGFNNVCYFTRTFKKILGMTPTEIRNWNVYNSEIDIKLHGKFNYRYYSC